MEAAVGDPDILGRDSHRAALLIPAGFDRDTVILAGDIGMEHTDIPARIRVEAVSIENIAVAVPVFVILAVDGDPVHADMIAVDHVDAPEGRLTGRDVLHIDPVHVSEADQVPPPALSAVQFRLQQRVSVSVDGSASGDGDVMYPAFLFLRVDQAGMTELLPAFIQIGHQRVILRPVAAQKLSSFFHIKGHIAF